jgi:hypothetical protein
MMVAGGMVVVSGCVVCSLTAFFMLGSTAA